MATGGDDQFVAMPGYRFYPTEEELLGFYLRHRLAGTRPGVERFIPVVDVYSYRPSQLQSMAGEANVKDKEQWFFFCPRAEREAHGGRPARTTPSGYWKATGSPSCVFSSSDNRVIGVKRTMVFYEGRAPTGTKTQWKMNEYKAVDHLAAAAAPSSAPLTLRNEFSVCRVYISTGTLRSFDRRPLIALNHHHHQAVHLHHQQLPPPAAAAGTSQLAANLIVGNRDAAADNSHDSSSSGSRGAAADDGGADQQDAAFIDWNSYSLIAPADDFRFSVDDFNCTIVEGWPQI